jgi:YegS/Rv2252/BmrU family lipid kinase
MAPSIVIIYNPSARRASRKKIEAARAFLAQRGFSPEVFCTEKSGDAEAFARQIKGQISHKPHMVIAAGGDGTINEVVNGMACSDIPIGVLPLGTTNVLAREIYEDHHPDAILARIISGSARRVSLGQITCYPGGNPVSRYFVLMAGIGFDGQAVRDINLYLKKHTGPGAYILSGLQTLLNYSPEELVLTVDGREVRGYAAIIGNVSRYGGDFRITPDARIYEPSLYACIFQGRKRADLLRYVSLMTFGRHTRARDVVYTRAEEITITGSSPVQIDGDYFGMADAKITVAKDVISLIC